MEEDLLSPASFSTQPNLIDNMMNFNDPPMFNDDFKNEPMFSSGASDSGLSSDNLDLYVWNHVNNFGPNFRLIVGISTMI